MEKERGNKTCCAETELALLLSNCQLPTIFANTLKRHSLGIKHRFRVTKLMKRGYMLHKVR